MADPVLIACPADVWTKVATNVTTGLINIFKKTNTRYYQTYRDTGGGAPSNTPNPQEALFEGVPIITTKSNQSGRNQIVGIAAIEAVTGVDIYIYAEPSDGEVRADL